MNQHLATTILLIKTTEYVLAYAIDISVLKQEGKREGEAASMPRAVHYLRALPALVVCCICTKPYDIKSFHVGSVFHLDVVLSSGFAWAWLGVSSSSPIPRDTLFVL